MMEKHTQFMLFRRRQQIGNRGIIRSITVLQYWNTKLNRTANLCLLAFEWLECYCQGSLMCVEVGVSGEELFKLAPTIPFYLHVSSWDAREVIGSILWWVFHLVRSRISLTFFSSRINNIYYFSSRGCFFWKHDCFNRWEWKQTCKNSTLYN